MVGREEVRGVTPSSEGSWESGFGLGFKMNTLRSGGGQFLSRGGEW